MSLDEALLRRARAAAADLARVERQAALSRAELHTAIRRLHLAGASLLEIEKALSLGGQRVQEIVQPARNSWWKRMWRGRRVHQDAACSFCRRSADDVARLIAGPDLHICDSCIARAERALSGARRVGPFTPVRKGEKGRCSFCGKRADEGAALLAGKKASVCGDCLRLCREILDNRAA